MSKTGGVAKDQVGREATFPRSQKYVTQYAEDKLK
jgi:hypothetical protein